jgi:hypothetical protein
MVLANQNAKLTGPDEDFLVPRLVLIRKPWERGWLKLLLSQTFLCILLRGDFLEYRVIGAQKYRHALRENGAICCFCKNGWIKI